MLFAGHWNSNGMLSHSPIFTVLIFISTISASNSVPQFTVDYEQNTFKMDGEPFQYVSGSMHYFRCPSVYWRDRLRKMREAGLNAVSTYVEWSQHEKVPGEYDFSGELNVTDFIRIAAEEDLYVILRPGPYICAERDMGGLPFWLLQVNPNVQLRTSDPTYRVYVERWMNVLLAEVAPTFYGNGGPVILLQVENEYGSYYACDGQYLIWLRDLFRRHVANKAVLFTTDGAASSFLKCGKIPGVYATVDFGSNYNVTAAFAAQRRFEPRGPLVNSEFYPGWLTHWGEPMATINSTAVTKSLEEMLRVGANINFYMFHGGTNFGFTAGANMGTKYQSDITSYDYDAPLTEAGDITPKYNAIREVLLKYFPGRRVMKRTLDKSQKGAYGEIQLAAAASLLGPSMRMALGKTTFSKYPQSFESLGQNFGYLLYESALPYVQRKKKGGSIELSVPGIRDRAVVFVNGNRVGKLSREHNTSSLRFTAQQGDQLGIIVENLGRINYGTYNNDSKGILSNVTLNGNLMEGWTMTGFEMKSVAPVSNCANDIPNNCLQGNGFTFYSAKFVIDLNTTQPLLPDSFLDISKLEKGVVFINGMNLGRYWSTRGPQYNLYVPGSFLKKGPAENTIVIMDEVISSTSITVTFMNAPIL